MLELELEPINLKDYVRDGWRAFVAKEYRKALKRSEEGKTEAEREAGAAGLLKWQAEAIKLGIAKAAAAEMPAETAAEIVELLKAA
jgi:hypothetical protein